MDTRKRLLLQIKRAGLAAAILIGLGLWPQLIRGRMVKLAQTPEGARSFRRATTNPDWSSDLSSVAVNADGQVFAAAGGDCGNAGGEGIFRSSDNGETWARLADGLSATSARSLVISESGAIFAGTNDGVFRSTDNGDTWAPTSLRGVDVSTMASRSGILFAGDGCACSGLYRSRDDGVTWEHVKALGAACVKGLAIDAAGGAFAATADGLYRSPDRGDHWISANDGLTTRAFESVAVAGPDDVFLGSESEGIFRSMDGGVSWEPMGLSGERVNALTTSPGGEIFAGTDTAVYLSVDNGESWTNVDRGSTGSVKIGALAYSQGGIAFAAAGRNILRTVTRTRGDPRWKPAAVAAAAPTVDSSASASGALVTTLTWSHTVGAGTNQVLIVGTSIFLSNKNNTVSGVTYGGVPLTSAGSIAGTRTRAQIWYLVSPAQGTANVVATLSAAADIAAGSTSFNGVDPATPLGAFASATGSTAAPSVIAQTIAGASIVIDTLAAEGDSLNATAGPGQTAQWNLATGQTNADVRGAGSVETSAQQSVQMTWTLTAGKPWALGAVSLNGVGACCGACVITYPYFDPNHARTSVIFNENEQLAGVNGPPQGCLLAQTAAIIGWYSDEHALTLGVRQVNVITQKTCTGGSNPGAACTSNTQCTGGGKCVGTATTSTYPVSPLNKDPFHATTHPQDFPAGTTVALQTGTNALTGDQAGTDTNNCPSGTDPNGCGRPMWPVLFVTDITDNPTSTAGDWQFDNPHTNDPTDVFGTWKSAVRNVDQTVSPAAVSVVPDADPIRNFWNLGPGADPVPPGLASLGYGTEVRWNLEDSNNIPLVVDQNGNLLVPNRKYRLQVLVHDGDQNKSGGDAGQGCAVTIFQEQCTPTPTPTSLTGTPTNTPTPTPTNTPTETPTLAPVLADLSVTKASNPTCVAVDIQSLNGDVYTCSGSDNTTNPCGGTLSDTVVYTIGVKNSGPGTAASVTITDPLPQYTTFSECTFVSPSNPNPTQCSSSGTVPAVGTNGTVTVTIGDLGPSSLNNSGTVTLTVIVDGNAILNAGNVTFLSNNASVSSLTGDPNSSNNQVTINKPTVNHCHLPTLRRVPNDR